MTSADEHNPAAAKAEPPARDIAAMFRSAIAPFEAKLGQSLDRLGRHRDEVLLTAAAALYLALTFGFLFGRLGVVIGLLVAALVWRMGRAVPADTLLSLYRAQPIAPRQGSALRAAISTLSQRAGLLHEPAIAIVPSLAAGTFSAGRGARVAILMTEGLLRRFSLPELVAIVAHEIAHIRRGDLSYFSLTDSLTRLAQTLAYFGIALLAIEAGAVLIGERVSAWLGIFLLLAAPALNSHLQLAMPRQREYAADELAATLLGERDLLARAIRAMATDTGEALDDFRFPVPQRRAPIPSPGRAHISPAERADHLLAAVIPAANAPFKVVDEPLVSLVGVGPIEMRPRNRWPGLWF